MIEKREKCISQKADFFSLVSSLSLPSLSVCVLFCSWKHSFDRRGVSIKERVCKCGPALYFDLHSKFTIQTTLRKQQSDTESGSCHRLCLGG